MLVHLSNPWFVRGQLINLSGIGFGTTVLSSVISPSSNTGFQRSAGVAFPSTLTFDHVSHDYAGQSTVDDICLTAEAGRILCLLGPSGSGKTTLLRLAAGVETPSSGRILLSGREVGGPNRFVPPEQRGVGLMFQDFALFPHMTVLDNVRFGLTALSAGEARDEAMAALERVGMSHYARQYPHALSGGEQQRVALARALAPRPSVLLMDEPFSGLDSRLKDSVRSETLAILRETGATTVVVTHDAEEAMRMADSIALLNNGQVVQTGNAEELYYRPANLFAAGFLSDINILHARVSGGKTETPLGSFQASRFRDGENVTVAIRLSDIEVSESKGTIPARIVYRRFLGVFDLFALSVPGLDGMVRVRALAGSLKSDLHDVMLYVNERDILMFKSA